MILFALDLAFQGDEIPNLYFLKKHILQGAKYKKILDKSFNIPTPFSKLLQLQPSTKTFFLWVTTINNAQALFSLKNKISQNLHKSIIYGKKKLSISDF